jgi:hypothetical protein
VRNNVATVVARLAASMALRKSFFFTPHFYLLPPVGVKLLLLLLSMWYPRLY